MEPEDFFCEQEPDDLLEWETNQVYLDREWDDEPLERGWD